MILGTGIDIIEIGRIRTAIGRESFISRIFTPGEQAYCESRGAQRPASYAARFAAKEAVMKAFGTGLAGGNWTDIEVVPADGGRPVVRLHGSFARLAEAQGIGEVHISLTHAREYAAAQAILWGRGNR